MSNAKHAQPGRKTARSPDAIVLASASPRRRELLTEAGVPHEVVPAGVDERALPGESAREMVLRLAELKASTVARRLRGEPGETAVGKGQRRLVLGSDTVVVLDGVVFGKPADPEHAVELLRALCGRTHRVITGVAVVTADGADLHALTCAVESEVTMRAADDAELKRYVATGEPLDKAGAYAIQGEGGRLVSGLSGSRTNVIGLPVDETLALLDRARAEARERGVRANGERA